MAKDSPCIRICCLSEKDVCLGCFRHLDEILSWHKMDNQQKHATLLECQKRKEQRLGNVKTDFDS
ncbi:DUF1289 domain-containing protein [Pseudoalteromonas sp. NBT06-2]|uniref:DUF1289 domain-containing protein n=1 Tax=Pseudoalteromonas sp. NBT06-2 TaxID=2025950 RepID=UPI000BA787DA|nr:DUF1289 domain-containing protein [Pseudoalteromonas sp. NBT06-2]PAJ72501.1 DUF1289 domain-containing protein [Pseudoalteromonas sp. NBT06-2]